MIESSMMINDRMPEYCVERAGKILNRFKKALNGSKILILGVAYKQDIDDYRESPAIRVIEIFSFTRPIFTFRYVFSSIFSISATAGDDTS